MGTRNRAVGFSPSNNFDVLRLSLACLVATAHFNVLSGLEFNFFILRLSSLAVDAFFVVSGFLIAWSYNNDDHWLRYCAKRFFRIYPLYFTVISLQILVFIILVGENAKLSEYLKYALSNYIFLNFLAPSVGDVLLGLNRYNAINGSLWTLKVEVGFYMLLPVFVFLAKDRKLFVFFLLYILSAIFYVFSRQNDLGLDEQLPAQIRFFVVGMLFLHYGRALLVGQSRILCLYLSFSLVSAITAYFDFVVFDAFCYPILVGSVVYFVCFFLPPVSIRWDLSYSIYVVHFPVIQLLLYFDGLRLGYIGLALAFSFFVAVLSLSLYACIERPFMRIGRKLLREK